VLCARLRRSNTDASAGSKEEIERDRCERQAAELKRATALYQSTRKLGVPFDPAFFGFVFSLAELEERINRDQAAAFAQGQPSDFTKEQFVACFAQWKERQAA
jgi:hypothetical protein